MEALSAWFERLLFPQEGNPPQRPALTVIGSGGKTSLIWLLARKLSRPGRRVLVAPSTRMYPPAESIPGVETVGTLNRTTGKLEALLPEELERAALGVCLANSESSPDNRDFLRHQAQKIHKCNRLLAYDLVLIEGDGSRGLPLKGWAPGEPVVPGFTGFTVGIIPLWPLGEEVSERIIHRLPLFCRLSGAREGETLTPEHLVRVITGCPDVPGLFAAAKGEKILIFNQIEDDAALLKAGEITARLPEAFRLGLCAVLGGSVRLDLAEVLARP